MGAQSSSSDIASGAVQLRTIPIPNNTKTAGCFVSQATSAGPIFVSLYIGDNSRTPVFSLGGTAGWVRTDANGMGSDSINLQFVRGVTPKALQTYNLVVQVRNDTGSTQTYQYGVSWED